MTNGTLGPRPEWLAALGLTRTHSRLEVSERAAVLDLAAWHDAADARDWPVDPPRSIETWLARAPRDVFRPPYAHYALGDEFAVALAKGLRLEGDGPPFALLDGPGDVVGSFADVFCGCPRLQNIRAGFFGGVSDLFGSLLAVPATRARTLGRLDAIDHAEAAARLRAIVAGFSPPTIAWWPSDRFPLLSRPGVWVISGGPHG